MEKSWLERHCSAVCALSVILTPFLIAGAILLGGYLKEPHNAQPATPTRPETPEVILPQNPLTNIYGNVERGMTRERLERRVNELNDGRLAPATKRAERVTTGNTSYMTEYWSWSLREGSRVTTLTIDLVEDKVVGLHYSTKREVDEINLHK